MISIERILLPFRFLKVVIWLTCLYIFSFELFYKLSPRLYEQLGIHCFQAFVHFLGINISYHHNSFPLPKPAIYICNHSSSFELFIMSCLLKNTHYVIDAEVMKIPILNKILKKGPVILVNRRSMKSRAYSIKQMMNILKSKKNVMLFPEGYSYKLLGERFATGAFRTSMVTGVPIVPIYLHYENLDVFVPDDKIDHKKEFFRILSARNKKINAYFFASISPTPFTNAANFRDYVYAKYCGWQKQFYGCADE